MEDARDPTWQGVWVDSVHDSPATRRLINVYHLLYSLLAQHSVLRIFYVEYTGFHKRNSHQWQFLATRIDLRPLDSKYTAWRHCAISPLEHSTCEPVNHTKTRLPPKRIRTPHRRPKSTKYNPFLALSSCLIPIAAHQPQLPRQLPRPTHPLWPKQPPPQQWPRRQAQA